jgi:hypothetical protein
MLARQFQVRIAALALAVAVLCALFTPRSSAAGVPTMSMPNPMLTTAEARAVSRYLLSQRNR